MLRKPNICELICPTEHKTKSQRTYEGSYKEKIKMYINKQSDHQSDNHAHLTQINQYVQMSVPNLSPFLSRMQFAGRSTIMQLMGQIRLGTLASNYVTSYILVMVGDMPEKAWVGIELARAAKTKRNQLTYRYESWCISMNQLLIYINWTIKQLTLEYKQQYKQGIWLLLQTYFFYNSYKNNMNQLQEKEQMTNNRSAVRNLAIGNIDQNRVRAANKLSVDLINQIEQEIQDDQFEINKVQKEFKMKPKVQADDVSKRLNQMMNKKQHVQNELNQVQKKQEQFKNNLNHSSSHAERKYFKSQLTEEEIDKIKKIKILQKKHQIDLENKTKLYEDNLKKFQEEEKQLLEKQKKQKNQERLKEVMKKIEEIRLRQEERNKKMQEQKKRIIQIKHEKKLYERLEEQYKSVEQKQQRKKQELKLVLKQQKVLNFDDIKEHQKKYDDIMRYQRQQRQKKLGELNKGTSKKYYQSKLLKQQMQEQERLKLQNQEKKNQLKQLYLKKQQYGEKVRLNYMPQVKTKQNESNQSKNQISRSVSVFEIKKLGNDYMKQANQNIKNIKGSSISKPIQKKEEPFRYKDYLKQIKVERKISSHKQSRYLQQIDKVMKKQNMTQQEKFIKAKQIAHKIQEKKGGDSQKLINSINAKIYLLKQIEPV